MKKILIVIGSFILLQSAIAQVIRDHRKNPKTIDKPITPPVTVISDATTLYAPQVVLFEHANFTGQSKSFGIGTFRLNNVADINDAGSSIRVAPGMVAVIYEHASEAKIDTWTILYTPPNRGKYNGKLTITNKRLLYDAKFDVSAKGLLSEALFIKWGSEGYLEIDKADIKEVQKSFLAKKAIVTLTEDSKHTFIYGELNVDKGAWAIKSN